MSREKLLSFSLAIMALQTIHLVTFQQVPGTASLVLALIAVIIPSLLPWITEQQWFFAVSAFIFRRQLKKYMEWLNENATGSEAEMDFDGAPWVPKYIREYYVRMGTLMQWQRFMQNQEAEQKKPKHKKKTRRGRRHGPYTH